MLEKFCAFQVYGLFDKQDYIHIFPNEVQNSFLTCGKEVMECPYKREDIKIVKRKKIIAKKEKNGKIIAPCYDFKPLNSLNI